MMIAISRATWRDTWELWRLMRACFGHSAYDPLSIFTLLICPGHLVLKACAAGQLGGFLAGEAPGSDEQAWVIALGVHPHFQRQGIATQLLHEWEKQWRQGHSRLMVRAGNQPALALYHKLAYVLVARRPHYYADGEDGFEMEKSIGTSRG
jgi:ribosomal protein S18 acetylase RimI-like enzyme